LDTYGDRFTEDMEEYIYWLESIIEAINDGILVIDTDGIVRLINQEYTNITGVTKDMILNMPLISIRHGALLPSTLEDGRPREGIYRKEGKNEYIVDMAPIYDKNKKIIGAVSVCKSVREINSLTKELYNSRKKLQQLENVVGSLYKASYSFENIIGNNERLHHCIELAKKAAKTDLNVLLIGESGTGKELFAQAIHQTSERKSAAFVAVNCATIPPALFESELFGYEEGSFTNSKRGGKMGLIELANGGTLFLDEIGDMPLDMQAKLLRVLQEGYIRKVGSLEEIPINIRVIAATNKNLKNMLQLQRFRDDLYFRLNAFELQVPSLRERKSDIPKLVDYFLKKAGQLYIKPLPSFMEGLQQYDWPGNIRELRNTIHYAMNITETNELTTHHLPDPIKQSIQRKQLNDTGSLADIVKNAEKEAIINILKTTGFDLNGKKAAAKKLRISLATLYNKLSQYEVSNSLETSSKKLEYH